MICFDIDFNGHRLTAGIRGGAVLSATVTWVKRVKDPAGGTESQDNITFRVGGLDSKAPGEVSTFLDWVNARLQVGDRITLTVADREEVDPPAHRGPQPAGAS